MLLKKRAQVLLLFFSLQRYDREIVETLVNSAEYSESEYSCCADNQAQTGIAIAFNGGYRCIIRKDIHGFHNLQVIEKGDHRVEQSDEYQPEVSSVEG